MKEGMTRAAAVFSALVTLAVGVQSSRAQNPDKIEGPWLWVIAPTAANQGGANSTDVDSLDAASGGDVTEEDILKRPPREGDAVGDYEWTVGEIAPAGGNNVNLMINELRISNVADINDHTIYGWINIESRTRQDGVGRVGSDDSIKIWINGEQVHRNAVNRGSNDYQDTFNVELNRGSNPMLVKCSERGGGWTLFVGIEADNLEFNLDADNLSVEAEGNSAMLWGALKRR